MENASIKIDNHADTPNQKNLKLVTLNQQSVLKDLQQLQQHL